MKLLDTSDTDAAKIFHQFGVDTSKLSAELTRSLDKLKSGNARTPAHQPHGHEDADRSVDHRLHRFGAARCAPGSSILALATDEELRALMREVSKEFQKIQAEALKKDLLTIVRASQETTPATRRSAQAPARRRGAPQPDAAARRRISISTPST